MLYCTINVSAVGDSKSKGNIIEIIRYGRVREKKGFVKTQKERFLRMPPKFLDLGSPLTFYAGKSVDPLPFLIKLL